LSPLLCLFEQSPFKIAPELAKERIADNDNNHDSHDNYDDHDNYDNHGNHDSHDSHDDHAKSG